MFNRSVNKVVLVGNVGKDPEMKYLPNGNAVANFSIATTESWKNKQTGEYENKSEWHNLVVFGKFAELVGKYIKKGAKIYAEGKLQTSSWDDATTGARRYKTEIVVSDIQLLDAKNDSQGQSQQAPQQGGYQNQATQHPPAQQAAPQMAPAYQPQQATAQQTPAYQHPPQHAPQLTPAQQRANAAPQQAPSPQSAPSMDFDDSIPF